MRLLHEGPDIQDLLGEIRAQHGPNARIVKAERVRTGGIAGFFAKQHFEVTLEVQEQPGTAEHIGAAALLPVQRTRREPQQTGSGGTGGGIVESRLSAPTIRGLEELIAAADEEERIDHITALSGPALPDDEPGPPAASAATDSASPDDAGVAPGDDVATGLDADVDTGALIDEAMNATTTDAFAAVLDRITRWEQDTQVDQNQTTQADPPPVAEVPAGLVDDLGDFDAASVVPHEAPVGVPADDSAQSALVLEFMDATLDGWGIEPSPAGQARPDAPARARAMDDVGTLSAAISAQRRSAEDAARTTYARHALVNGNLVSVSGKDRLEVNGKRVDVRPAGAHRADLARPLLASTDRTPAPQLPSDTPTEAALAAAAQVPKAQIPVAQIPAARTPQHVSAPVEDTVDDAVDQASEPHIEPVVRPAVAEPALAAPPVAEPPVAEPAVAAPIVTAPVAEPAVVEPALAAMSEREPAVDAGQDAEADQPTRRSASRLRQRLGELGLPASMIRQLPAEPAMSDLVEVLSSLPRASSSRPEEGEVIAVVVEPAEADAAGARLARRWRLGTESVAGRSGKTSLAGDRQARRLADEARSSGDPRMLVLDAELNGFDAEWAGDIIAAAMPDRVLAVVDATRKAEDIATWLTSITARVDALLLVNTASTTTPAAVLGLGIPIAELDGRPGTAAEWAALLMSRAVGHSVR